MKAPTFLEGVALALAAAISGSVLFSVLKLLLPADTVLRLLISLLTLAYTGYLMHRARERPGRVTAFSGWVLATAGSLLLPLPLIYFLLPQCLFIWLVRSFYIHKAVPAAVADLGLSALSLAAALWAAAQTGNLFLSIWCFFLTQALFVAIPKGGRIRRDPGESVEDGFDQAFQTAQKALSNLVYGQQHERR